MTKLHKFAHEVPEYPDYRSVGTADLPCEWVSTCPSPPSVNLPPAAPGPELVKNPAHYARLDPEPWDVIWSWYGLAGCLSHVVKYLARAGHKPGASAVTDLEKAREWLDYAIGKLKT